MTPATRSRRPLPVATLKAQLRPARRTALQRDYISSAKALRVSLACTALREDWRSWATAGEVGGPEERGGTRSLLRLGLLDV